MSAGRWSALVLGGLAVLGAVVIALRPHPKFDGPVPSAVVLVTVDTLRADAVSFSPAGPKTTPYLDTLAARGVVFDDAYAPSSWTPPSMASLMTGVFPTSHGITRGAIRNGSVREQQLLPPSFATLAEAFKAAGYVTIGVPANRHLAAELGFAQGFDYYTTADFINARVVNENVEQQMQRAFGPEWPATWKQRKTFLWIHYFDPHDPYYAREPWISRRVPDFRDHVAEYPKALAMKYLKRRYPEPDADVARRIRVLYESEVSFFDHFFRLIGERLGLDDDNVLFILTSDHGEEIVDHGGLGHSTTLHEELVHVPLLIRWPAAIPGGRHTDVSVSTVDLYPTLAELLGLSAPRALQGMSFAPLLRGQPLSERPPIYFELHKRRNPAKAIRDGDWKLIRDERPGFSPMLFNLSIDPHEQNDVAVDNRKIVRRLQKALTRRAESLPPPTDRPTRVLQDEGLKEQLRALGYLDDQ